MFEWGLSSKFNFIYIDEKVIKGEKPQKLSKTFNIYV